MARFLLCHSALIDALSGEIDFEHDSFKAMLLSSAYKPDKRHSRRSDLVGEIEGKGYDAGGVDVAISLALELVPDTKGQRAKIVINIGKAEWARATITARYLAYYKPNGGGAALDPLVGLIDFENLVVSTAGPFTVDPSVYRIRNWEDS
jgi:hypothetical protein